jgi:hypothetical protein
VRNALEFLICEELAASGVGTSASEKMVGWDSTYRMSEQDIGFAAPGSDEDSMLMDMAKIESSDPNFSGRFSKFIVLAGSIIVASFYLLSYRH